MPMIAIAKVATMQTEGWICPRCGRVNAPWLAWCGCSKMDVTCNTATASTQDPCMIGLHDWKRVGYRSSQNPSSVCTVEFECSRCGKREFVDTPTGNAMYTGNEKGVKDLTIGG